MRTKIRVFVTLIVTLIVVVTIVNKKYVFLKGDEFGIKEDNRDEFNKKNHKATIFDREVVMATN
ncbi:hypothetical protein ACWOFR_00085 [Carnobacterium gallinarum]|uniref:hypothetical protein n=1 Tax=Carnobacterium gallinarum TaxID=2749 RepID=UPI00054E359F|nr:hypothetical protein [Carnobacterium gallinarum]